MRSLFIGMVVAAGTLAANPIVYDGRLGTSSNTFNDQRYYMMPSLTLSLGASQPVTFDSLCIDFDHHIDFGIDYEMTLTKAWTGGKDPKMDLAAWLYVLAENPGVGEKIAQDSANLTLDNHGLVTAIQYTLWELFGGNPADVYPAGYDTTYTHLIAAHPGDALAYLNAANPALLPQVQQVYTVQGYGKDQGIQKLIIGGSVPTPEPATMGLIGTGLVALGCVMRRRVS